MYNISVCMATYNGIIFIEQQLTSILNQLSEHDELIVVDDCSTDGTAEYIRKLNDKRIAIYVNSKNEGPCYSFGKSMTLANNDFIVLSDQDDVWTEGRLKCMYTQLLASNAYLLSSNQVQIDYKSNQIIDSSLPLKACDSEKCIKNIYNMFLGRIGYYGCTMMIKRQLLDIVLPIPDYVESHDLWIAMAANIIRLNLHIEDVTLKRRVHGTNYSIIKRPVMQKMKSRFIFLRSMIELISRVLHYRRVHG